MDSHLLNQLRQRLREGDPRGVLNELKKLPGAKISARLLSDFADLARLTGAPDLAVRWLAAVVRPSGGRRHSASPRERRVYAASLIRLGANEEALELLESIPAKEEPEALLFTAHAHMARWNYARAIPELTRLLAEHELPPDRKVIANVNLLASLIVEERFAECEPLLAWLETETARLGMTVYSGVAMELGTQLALGKKEWDRAGDLLDRGEKFLGGADSLEGFFLKKWRAVLDVRRTGDFFSHAKRWSELRRAALGFRHWESLRDLDYLKACVTGDERFFVHLYFGTPYEAYRRRLYKGFARPVELPVSYAWRLGKKSGTARKIPLAAWPERAGVKATTIPFRLLTVLSSDFYRPFRVAGLHSEIYPGEHYNPDSSVARIYQALADLRRVLEKARMPLTVRHVQDGYRLTSPSSCSLVVGRESSLEELTPLGKLRTHFSTAAFTAEAAGRRLGLSRATVNRLLSEAIAAGKLARLGRGPETRYSFDVPQGSPYPKAA